MYKNTISILDHKKRAFILYALLVLAWMLLIFYFSAQHATASTSMSDGVIVWLQQYIFLDFISLESIQVVVRKTAHFLEYSCLAILLYQMLSQTTISNYVGRLAIVISFIYACSDEFHQLFVPGRAGMWQDVLIDTMGASFGVIVIISVYHILNRNKRRS